MTRIVLADDHPMIQSAVASLLKGTRYTLVASASTGAEALEAVEREQPDIVVLDVQMPEGNGIHVLRQLRAGDGEDRPVILLTASIEDHQFADALKMNVEGVLLKNSDPALLLDCLDSVSRGEDWIDPALRERAISVGDGVRVSLSPRERELVALVSQGLRNRDIAEELGITEGTVKVYLHSIFEKTGVANRTELAIRAREFVG